MVGKFKEISPRSAHASLQRKNVSVQSVMYVICLLINERPAASEPDNFRKIAPISLIPSLLAARIFVFTGRRSELVRPNWRKRLVPAKQLLHHVSARAGTCAGAVSLACGVHRGPVVVLLTLKACTLILMVGWGFERPFFQVCDRLSNKWWSMAML